MGESRLCTGKLFSPAHTTLTFLQDDPSNATDTHGRFLSFRHSESTSTTDKDLNKHTVSPNLTMDQASPYILTHTPATFQKMMESNYSYGYEGDEERLKANDRDHRKVSSFRAKMDIS
jgi:phospholipid:diacylglycerol acyltransferase